MIQHHSNKIPKECGLIKNPMYPVVLDEVPEDVYHFKQILKLFKEGVLPLDEVDLLLHPLKSELNWRIGNTALIDFTKSNTFGIGLRWVSK